MGFVHTAVIAAALTISGAASGGEIPDEISAKGETVVLQVHAVGLQIYDCKAGAGGKMTWKFREPIATLIRDGITVGRHYAGPTWEIEGSAIIGKVIASAASKDKDNIPLLKVEVTDRRGDGPLKDVTTIQRINTDGGTTEEEECEGDGALNIEPYTADYVFLKKP